jgi:hypothetical protein
MVVRPKHVADNLNETVNNYWNRVASDANPWTWSNTRNRMQTTKFNLECYWHRNNLLTCDTRIFVKIAGSNKSKLYAKQRITPSLNPTKEHQHVLITQFGRLSLALRTAARRLHGLIGHYWLSSSNTGASVGARAVLFIHCCEFPIST